MAAASAVAGPSVGSSALYSVNDNQKRWMVFGIGLKVVVDQVRSFVEQEVKKEYINVKTNHSIDTQSTPGRLKNWPNRPPRPITLKYENINGNDTLPKVGRKYNYAAFDCRVTSHVHFAKMYVENFMAKFNAFDEHCDASAVLTLLGKVPVFSAAVQSAAGNVRQARNAWAHCAFNDWDPVKFGQTFHVMEQLVIALGLPASDETRLLADLKEWETKGTLLCMNANVDPALLHLVQQHVNALESDVDNLAFEVESDREAVKKALQEVEAGLEELEKRVSNVERGMKRLQDEQGAMDETVNSLKLDQVGVKCSIQCLQDEQTAMDETVKSLKVDQEGVKCSIQCLQDEQTAMKSDQEDLQQRVTQVEEQISSAAIPQISCEISNCEADIAFFAERHDPDTRQWLFDDFDRWFSDPGDSRAYVLLGDAGVGKSVMAGVLAQRKKKAGHLGVAYFCRHNDGTRNDPRYLLGTVASQLCQCSTEYNNIVAGEGGVRMMLANSKLGVLELFTKLLQEPLGKCTPCEQRKLVIIDALDETEYESREDFLDLLMHRFPRLPKWLVFFITSRPEDTVQSRLKMYNPCIKICAGNADHVNFYRQHEQDIQRFVEKRIDFSCLPYSVEDVMKKCNGLFLYAFYIVKLLSDPVLAGKIGNLSDLFPGDIDDFFRKNFQRVFDKVGADLYRKLFSCVLATPSPLPVSFISFILKRENSKLDEQEVIDAVSQFVVLRTSDETFTFLHNLIPSWLTDRKKSSRRFFMDRVKAGEFLRNIILEFLPAAVNDRLEKHLFVGTDFLDYVLRVGVRILCSYDEKESLNTVFGLLTDYRFIQKRVQKSRIEIYSVVGDFKLAARCQALGNAQKQILLEICAALESNIHVLVECPHLLPLCLRNASEAVQRYIRIPAGESVTWMELNWNPYPADDIPRDMDCFALSPDKTLLAGGKGQYISLFDARSLKRVLSPVKVVETKPYISHLAFSPDGKFVFFGMLDRWFSVKQECVHYTPPFSENCSFYEWGCFTLDGRYIIVKRPHRVGVHRLSCLARVCCLWAMYEVDELCGNEMLCSCDSQRIENFEVCPIVHCSLFDQREAVRDLLGVLRRKQHNDWYFLVKRLSEVGASNLQSLCFHCYEFQCLRKKPLTLAIIHQRIIDLYRDIFETQVWNLESGRPALEEVFFSGVELSPVLYLCHLTTALGHCGALFSDVDRSLSVCNVAFINAVFCMLRCIQSVPWGTTEKNLISPRLSSFWFSSFSSCFLKSVPADFQNYLGATQGTRLSLDGKWMAKTTTTTTTTTTKTVELFQNTNQQYHVFDLRNPVHVVRKVDDFDFTNSSNALVYVDEGKLRALPLHSGTILSSISELSPLCYTPKPQAGYVFRAKNGGMFISVSDFPVRLLRDFPVEAPDEAPVGVTFTSGGDMLSLWSHMTLISWTNDDNGCFAFAAESSLTHPPPQDSQVSHIKKCAFSREKSSLIATHRDTKILLFGDTQILLFRRASFLCAVFEESGEEQKSNVSCLTFSADGTLLLCCIERSNCFAVFCAWDVQKAEMSTCFDVTQFVSVDCCCLSSDNSKLIICGETSVEIWEYAVSTCHLTAKLEPGRPYVYNDFEKFSHCTVSLDSNLLACCIADRILLCPLSTPTQQSLRQLPLAHLGKIEFCQFLKGTLYLISYGVDGAVFLWDLSDWNAVTYAKIAHGQESIISMAVSPEEDKVVCLTSCNRLSVIKLHGLKSETMPLQLPPMRLTGREDLTEANRGQLGERPVTAFQSATVSNNEGIVEAIDVGKLLEEMNFVLSSDEGEEGGESDDEESNESLTEE